MRAAYDPDHVLQQYEALRREALDAAPFGPRGHGLALFLARGMADWLAALTALGPGPMPPRAPAEPSLAHWLRLPPSARVELTTVLASMVCACMQETEGMRCTVPAR